MSLHQKLTLSSTYSTVKANNVILVLLIIWYFAIFLVQNLFLKKYTLDSLN